jgi:hypothetical protein
MSSVEQNDQKKGDDMQLTKKQLRDLKDIHNIQGYDGNWNNDQYMLGMFNGMELMLSIVEDREPVYRTLETGK